MAYLLRRTAVSIITVIGAISLLFVVIRLVPGDPAVLLLGPRATPQLIEMFREEMGLNTPLHVAIPEFLYKTIKLDFGTDPITRRPVASFILAGLPHTIALAFSGLGLALILGIPLGCYSAVHQGTLFDMVSKLATTIAITVPPFVMAILLLLAFALRLGWFPVLGVGEPGNIIDLLWHLILPSIALSVSWIGYIARMTRSLVLEVLNEDYIRTARAAGLGEPKVVLKYALRNAVIPIVSLVGVGFGKLLGGALFVEIIFTRLGLGQVMYNAIIQRNFIILEYTAIVVVSIYVFTNMMADISHSFLDPRIRRS